MKKRVLSLFLVLTMCLTLLPTATFAEGEDGTGDVVVQEQEPATEPEPEPAPEPEVADVQDDAEDSGEPEEAIVPQSDEDGNVKNVAKDSHDNYYTNIVDALNQAPENSVVYLLTNATIEGDMNFTSTEGTSRDILLDLSGYNFTCNGTFLIGKENPSAKDEGREVVLSFRGSGNINANITVISNGSLDLLNWEGGTVTSVTMETYGGFGSPEPNKDCTIQKLQLNCTDINLGKIKLSGGKYTGIVNNTGSTIKFSDLLNYAAFYNKDGTLLKCENTIEDGGELKNYTVADHPVEIADKEGGSCIYCNAPMNIIASVTTTSGGTESALYYKNLSDAFAAANKDNGCTLTLLDDVSIDENEVPPFVTGSFTLDLNGHKMDAVCVGQDYDIENSEKLDEPIPGNLTIVDNGQGMKGSITEDLQLIDGTLNIQGGIIGKVLDDGTTAGSLSCDSGIVTINGGAVYGLTAQEGASVTVSGGSGHSGTWSNGGGTLTITAGAFDHVTFSNNGGTTAISGGTFGTITNTDASGKIPVMPLLAKGYAFYKEDAVQDGSTDDFLTSVAVKEHTHTIVDNKCACGFGCAHANVPETGDKSGLCPDCGTQFAAKVTDKDGNVTYYADGTNDKGNTVHGMFYALKNAPDGSTIKALTSGRYDVTITGGKTLTLDMNGTTNNGGSITLGVVEGQNIPADTGNTLILTGSGTLVSYAGRYSTITVYPDNTLTVGKDWNGDLGQVRLYLAYKGSAPARAQLSGGTFQSIGPQSWDTASTTAGSYLAEGYAFRDTDGKKAWVRYDTVLKTEKTLAKNPLENVEVVKCTNHIDSDGDAHCDYCNRPASGFTASVTTKTGETATVTYYDDFVEAFNAARGNDTVTLLQRVEIPDGVTINNDHANNLTLDLNGFNLSGNSKEPLITVSQDMTICDSKEGTDEWYWGCIWNSYKDSDTIRLTGGHLTFRKSRIQTLSGGYALYAEGGSITVEDGWFTNEVFIGSTCTTEIKNGKFLKSVSIASPNAKIVSGEFQGTVSLDGPGAVINGGSFGSYVYLNGANAKVNGGSFVEIFIQNSPKAISGGSIAHELKNLSGTVGDLLADGYAFKHGSDYDGAAGKWLTEAELAAGSVPCVDAVKAPITSVSLTADRTTVAYGSAGVRLTAQSTASSEGSVTLDWYLNDSSTPFASSTDDSPRLDLTSGYFAAVGTYKFRVVFTKDGYSKSAELTVTVEPADISSATVTPSAPTYNGQEQTPTVEVTLGGKTLTAGTDYKVTVTPQKNAGSYTLTATGIGNYTGEKIVSWNINQLEVTNPLMTLEYTTHVYTGEEIRPAVTVKDGEIVIPASEYTVSYEDNTNVGTATVTVTNKAGGNYQVAEVSTSFTITRADASVTAAPMANTLTYNGGAQPLVTAGTASGGTIMYRLGDSGEFSASLPTAVNAGEYTVYYAVAGDDNHNDTAPQSVTATIAKASVTVMAKNKSAYVGGTVPVLPAEPVKDTDYTVSGLFGADTLEGTVTLTYDGTPDMTKAGTATIKINGTLANDNYAITYADGTLTITTRPSSGGASASGSTTTKTETTTNPDGSTTKTETKSDGTVVETTTSTDGSTTRTETKPDGSSVTESKTSTGSTGTVKTDADGKTEADAKISTKAVEDAKKSGEAVKVPTEVKAGEDSNSAPTVKIELPRNAGETKIEIPVEDVNSGTVAVIVHEDGTEEIVMDSLPTESGVQLTINETATVKIIDNSKDFIDTKNHWAEDAIDFVSARGLVNGVSATMYAPDTSTTRAQLWTILARQDGADLTGGTTWYEKAQAWSVASGISDGTDPNGTITRAQMVTMLWRAAGSPAAQGGNAFADVAADSYYAQAVTWAVEHGITTGVGNGKFDPNGTCTRAQIAAFLMRSYQNR